MHFNRFNPHLVRTDLLRIGAAHVPDVIPAQTRTMIQERVFELPFTPEPLVYGSAGVLQDYEAVKRSDSIPWVNAFRDVCFDFFESVFRSGYMYPFQYPFRFLDASIQRYPKYSLGISMHRDSKRCRNAVILLNVQGTADFVVSTAPDGEPTSIFSLKPGDVVIMRAAGFIGEDGNTRPYHSVRNMPGERLSIGMRDLPPGTF